MKHALRFVAAGMLGLCIAVLIGAYYKDGVTTTEWAIFFLLWSSIFFSNLSTLIKDE